MFICIYATDLNANTADHLSKNASGAYLDSPMPENLQRAITNHPISAYHHSPSLLMLDHTHDNAIPLRSSPSAIYQRPGTYWLGDQLIVISGDNKTPPTIPRPICITRFVHNSSLDEAEKLFWNSKMPPPMPYLIISRVAEVARNITGVWYVQNLESLSDRFTLPVVYIILTCISNLSEYFTKYSETDRSFAELKLHNILKGITWFENVSPFVVEFSKKAKDATETRDPEILKQFLESIAQNELFQDIQDIQAMYNESQQLIGFLKRYYKKLLEGIQYENEQRHSWLNNQNMLQVWSFVIEVASLAAAASGMEQSNIMLFVIAQTIAQVCALFRNISDLSRMSIISTGKSKKILEFKKAEFEKALSFYPKFVKISGLGSYMHTLQSSFNIKRSKSKDENFFEYVWHGVSLPFIKMTQYLYRCCSKDDDFEESASSSDSTFTQPMDETNLLSEFLAAVLKHHPHTPHLNVSATRQVLKEFNQYEKDRPDSFTADPDRSNPFMHTSINIETTPVGESTPKLQQSSAFSLPSAAAAAAATAQ